MARHFAETVRIQPDSASAQYNLGSARLVQGRRDEARQAFQRAVEIDPAYANAHRSLGMVLYGTAAGRSGAILSARPASSRPTMSPPTTTSPCCCRRRASWPRRSSQYREAVRIDDRHADAHYGLAVSFAGLGQFEQAVASAEKALGLAIAARSDRLAAQIREQLDAYRRRIAAK